MGRKRKKHYGNNNLQMAIFFIAFVVALFVVSVLLKIILIVKDSKFDGTHRFTIAVTTVLDQKSSQKTVELISFSPTTSSIQKLTVSPGMPIEDMERFMEVPIDATVTFSRNSLPGSLDTFFSQIKDSQNSLTVWDMARLWWFSKQVPQTAVSTQSLTFDSNLPKDAQVDQIDQKLFSDTVVSDDKESISIINGTDISGFGSRLSRLLTNIGANVVSIDSSDQQIDKTSIFYQGPKTYTVEKLEKILGVAAKEGNTAAISDIVINLGKDKSNTLAF